jgi:hypothetical protein
MDKEQIIKAIEKVELNLLANVGTTNAQSGVAKEFDIDEKNKYITNSCLDITSKALKIASAVIEITKNRKAFRNYSNRNPRKLVSIYNKVKKNDSKFYYAFDLKKATKITMFEKICLLFLKPKIQVDELENNTLVYKIFRGKMYIINHLINPPKHWNCRHKIVGR